MGVLKTCLIIISIFCKKRCFAKSEIIMIGNSEYRCDFNGQIVETKSETTIIRLPKNAQAMYSVNTERVSSCKNQRCILMTWQTLRDFERFLNRKYHDTGEGNVTFNNQMLLPGFTYLLHVIIKTGDRQVEEKLFTIRFDKEKNSRIPIGHLALDIGSSYIYSTSTLIVNANLTLCKNISDYYFKWNIVSKNGTGKILPNKSSKLEIKPETLNAIAYSKITIHCKVIELKNPTSMLEDFITVDIKRPNESMQNNIDVYLPFKYSTVSIKAPIHITPYIFSRISSNDTFNIEWSCRTETKYICKGQTTNDFILENGFSERGNYTIAITVSNKVSKKTLTCQLLVETSGPSIDMYVQHPINPEFKIKIYAKVYNLRTYCSVTWVSEKKNGLKLKDIPGFQTETFNIISKDNTFLKEIEEFGNITITKEFKIIIPTPSRTWYGLDSKSYEFILFISCPSLTEINNMTVIEEEAKDFVTIKASTQFTVPPRPVLESLEIYSDGNEALKSNYYFHINIGNSSSTTMNYKYGFILGDLEIIFYSATNVYNAKTVMPYNAEKGVETFVQACDYMSRCRKLFGPIVKTIISKELDETLLLKYFKQQLNEEDFYKSFSYAFIVVHSMKLFQKGDINPYLFSDEIALKLTSMLEENTTLKNLRFSANNFMKNVAIFDQYLTFSDDVIKKLPILREKLLSEVDEQKVRISRSISKSAEENDMELEKMRNYIITSDLNIVKNTLRRKSIEKEKQHFLNLLNAYMNQACINIHKGNPISETELNTAQFSIEKLTKRLIGRFVLIPYEDNSWNITAIVKLHMTYPSNSKLCLAKTVYKNYLIEDGLVFGATIISVGDLARLDMDINVTILMPFSMQPINEMQPKCLVYINGWNIECIVIKYFTKFVQCLCPSMGYYYLHYMNSTTESNKTEILMFSNITESFTNADDFEYDPLQPNIKRKKLSYVIIGSTVVGLVIVCYIIRKLTIPQPNMGLENIYDDVHYGHVMNYEAPD